MSVTKLGQLDESQQHKLLKRGVVETIVHSELLTLLNEGICLRLKMGFDPSAPDLTLGHAVGLRKLRQFQDLGHQVVVIVGDWTAQIGDPSGQSATRPMLTAEQVHANAETYLAQFFKIIDKDRTEIVWQSKWFGSFDLTEIIKLTGRFTVAQFLARDDFAKRMAANQPVAITELLYPLLQAYDSVAIESDIEFGGTDQKFNLLVGRDLQQMMHQRPQQCVLMPLLVGTDGLKKMSKSLGNFIALDDTPIEMFGKTMSLPDEAIMPYLENLTDIPDEELSVLGRSMENSLVNPMELKKRLARDLVSQFHEESLAIMAQTHFEKTVQHGVLPDNIPTYTLPTQPTITRKKLSDILVAAKLVSSSSEARRLINAGAVRVNNERAQDNAAANTLNKDDIVRVGRRRVVRIVTE